MVAFIVLIDKRTNYRLFGGQKDMICHPPLLLVYQKEIYWQCRWICLKKIVSALIEWIWQTIFDIYSCFFYHNFQQFAKSIATFFHILDGKKQECQCICNYSCWSLLFNSLILYFNKFIFLLYRLRAFNN